MEKDDLDSIDGALPSDPVKFIIMDSQCESEEQDDIHFPALQQAKAKEKPKRSSNILESLKDTSEVQKIGKVLVSEDSEYEMVGKGRKQGANSSSESIVVPESEDQMEVTVIERKAVDESKQCDKDPEERSDSGSSFTSNGKQNLGKYTTAEISHSQGAKVRGHLFPRDVDSSEVDLFPEEEVGIPSTPAEYIGSLQLSAQPMLVPETVDEDIIAVSPSQDSFPHVIPSSPTSDKEEGGYDPTAEQTLSDQPSDFNITVLKKTPQKEKNRNETQEFHLHFTGTEPAESEKQNILEEASVQILDKEDVIIISQDEDQQEIEYEESEEFALRLSPSQSTQRGSKSTDSKSLSEGNESFHLKVPREPERLLIQGVTEHQDKLASQSDQRASPGHIQEEDMITQTPEDLPGEQKTSGETERPPVKQTPSLTIEMINTDTQISEHSFNLNRPDIQVIESEQSPSQDTRTDVFRKIKTSEKSTSRHIIHDDSDEEISFKLNTTKDLEKTCDEERSDTTPKLKMSRTTSSEITSTGYQASMESMGDVTMRQSDGSVIYRDKSTDGQDKYESVVDVDKTLSYNTESYITCAGDNGKKDTGENVQIGECTGNRNEERSQQNMGKVTKDKHASDKSENVTEDRHSQKKNGTQSSMLSNQRDSAQSENLKNGKQKPGTKTKSIEQKTEQVIIKVAGSFKEVDRNVRNNGKSQLQTSAQHDPYEFHGSQSQQMEENGYKEPNKSAEVNPLEYYKSRKVIETPPSSRKRKRKVHKKTGLKSTEKPETSVEPPSDKHHVCFSSPVSESLTTPPTERMPQKASASSERTIRSRSQNIDVTSVRNIPTRTGQSIPQFSPSRDRIEDDFPNITTTSTLHRKPIVADHEQTSQTSSEMRPPASIPVSVKSPSNVTVVSTVTSAATPTTSTSTGSMLVRRDTVPLPEQQPESHSDQGQAEQGDIRIKTVTTKLVTYKTVETVEKVIFKDGTVKILSQCTKTFPRPVQTRTQTETTEEDYVMSDVSPSRTNSTVTSGDLGDISSSLSRSGSSGPSSVEVHRMEAEMGSQSAEIPRTRKSLDKAPAGTSPREVHHTSHSETYSPLDVSSIHKTSGLDADRRLSSENLFTSPDTSKGEEEIRKAPGGEYSDGITCAQRKILEPVQRSGEESEPLFVLPKITTTGSSGNSDEISPEIPYQDQAISTTKPDKQEEKPPEEERKKSVDKGARIMAKWKDNHFYPGVIKEVMGNSRYRVKFDDGDVLITKGCDILLIEKLPIGQPVMVSADDGYFYPGIITAETNKGAAVEYIVDQDNGQSGKFRYSQVILTEDQAVCLIADLHCQLSEPSEASEESVVKNPNVSLENLVIGKRRKGSKYEQPEMTTGSADDPGPSSAKKGKTPFSPTPAKRKNKSGPSTSTPRAVKRRKVAEDTAPESTPPVSAVSSPVTPRRSPRKGKGVSKQLPQKLFQGMYFMLTHVDKTPETLAMEKELLHSSSLETSAEESGPDDESHIPFDKDFLKTTIRNEGGMILDRIHPQLQEKLVFLISDSYHRTVKYFQTLAAGYPCVSHLWIRDSAQQNKILDYKSYSLQAGLSLEKKKVVEWTPHRGDLKNMTIMVESESEKMKEEWSNILQIAEANVVHKLHTKKSTDNIVRILVTDSSCKPQILRSARSLNVPIVSTEWIIQCLINGQVMDFDRHPRYQYDFAVI